jgi:hypothetical protein
MTNKPIILDLHGFSVIDALDLFADEYNSSLNLKHPCTIEVIHGYGSGGVGGEIRTRLRQLLDKARIEYTRGEDIDENFGITIVIVENRICNTLLKLIFDKIVDERIKKLNNAVAAESCKQQQSRNDKLESIILKFCESEKSRSKILSKFMSKYSIPEIDQAIKHLKQNNKLMTTSIAVPHVSDQAACGTLQHCVAAVVFGDCWFEFQG